MKYLIASLLMLLLTGCAGVYLTDIGWAAGATCARIESASASASACAGPTVETSAPIGQ